MCMYSFDAEVSAIWKITGKKGETVFMDIVNGVVLHILTPYWVYTCVCLQSQILFSKQLPLQMLQFKILIILWRQPLPFNVRTLSFPVKKMISHLKIKGCSKWQAFILHTWSTPTETVHFEGQNINTTRLTSITVYAANFFHESKCPFLFIISSSSFKLSISWGCFNGQLVIHYSINSVSIKYLK